MKLVLLIVLTALIFLVGIQIYHLYNQRQALMEKSDTVSQQVATLEAENKELSADFEYFSKIDNLVKEFKKLFNYKNPGEKIYIVIPKSP